VDGFDMEAELLGANGSIKVKPTSKWRKTTIQGDSITLQPDYFANLKRIGG
jgi:hypothetical protein